MKLMCHYFQDFNKLRDATNGFDPTLEFPGISAENIISIAPDISEYPPDYYVVFWRVEE